DNDTSIGELSNVGFNCQVLWPPGKRPSLIIHCIKNKINNNNNIKRDCKLKIGWMIIGYDGYDTESNFILPDFNVRLKVIKNDFNLSNNPTMFKTFHVKNNSLMRKPICIGIPVLNNLDYSNDSIIIGHNFFNAKEDSNIGVNTFSYNLRDY